MRFRFKTTRADGRSYRDVAVDMLKTLAPNTVVSYQQLAHELELRPSDRSKIQHAVNAANKVLLKMHNRGIINVPDIGYRVLEAREHMVAANRQQTRADRAMTRALRFYEGTNLSEMNERERHLHHGQHMLAQAIMASHRHLDKRIQKIEDLIKGTHTINED